MYSQLVTTGVITDKIAHTLGDDIATEYDSFNALANDFHGLFFFAKEKAFTVDTLEKLIELAGKLTDSAGKLHVSFRNKLISLRHQ